MSFTPTAFDPETRPWLAPEQRLQRRTFRDYQPLFMMMTGLACVDERLQRDFVCIRGPVWRRFNEATRRARQRRITVLFVSDENNRFQELLYVGCDYLRQRRHHVRTLWSHADWPLDEAMARHACIGLADRSVLRASALTAAANDHDLGPARHLGLKAGHAVSFTTANFFTPGSSAAPVCGD